MSRSSWFRSLLFLLVVVLAASGGTGAAAAAPTSANGTFTTTSAVFNSTRVAGGNSIMDLTAHVTYTGTFNGTSVVQGTLIFHADGSANFHDVETFTGSVNGISGTVTFNLAGTGSITSPTGVGSYEGTDVIVSGTGGLATLHGVISQVGTVPLAVAPGPLGTYTGQIQSGTP
jgi:hypothetical protein